MKRSATWLAAALLVLTACSGAPPTGDGRPSASTAASHLTDPTATTPAPPAPSATPAVPATATADEVRAAGTVLEPGGVVLLPAGGLTTQAGTDASLVVSVAAPDAQPGAVVAALAPPVGGEAEVLVDGSLLVRDATGRIVAGIAPPTTESATAGWDTGPSGTLHLVMRSAAGAGTAVTLWLGSATLASAEWGQREGGRSLAVVPTAWLRAGGQAATEKAWADLVALVPDADVPGMENQLVCHELGAADKATWNLEPGRPDVGLIATLAARCNP
jgi:hypothetical protein